MDNLETKMDYLINNVEIQSGWNAQQMPKTEYKQELKQLQACSVIKFYLNELDRLGDDDVKDVRKTPTELYTCYKQFCENNSYKALGSMAFTKISKPHGGESKSNGVRYKIYSHDSLLNSLSAYL